MNIAVFSPHTRRNGNTTVASMLALELSSRGKRVCLTHTNPRSTAMAEYFGLKDLGDDKTANPGKLVNMLKVGAVKPEEIPEYCKPISGNIDAFTTVDGSMKEEDIEFILNYMLDSFPHEYKVFDIDTDYFSSERTKKLLQRCDVIIIVTTQSLMELYDLKKELAKLSSLLKYKPAIMVVNKFDRHAQDIKSLQGVVGATVSKKSPWQALAYSSQFIRFSNFGKLLDLYNSMRNKDIPMMEAYKNLKNIANAVANCDRRGKQLKAKAEMDREAKLSKSVVVGNEAANSAKEGMKLDKSEEEKSE